MNRTRLVVGALAACFIGLLLYTTLASSPGGTGADRAYRTAAEKECVRAVQAQIPDARFPIGASVTDAGGGRYQIRGTLDSGSEGQMVRRNYDCLVQADGSGTFVLDSVQVWQSH